VNGASGGLRVIVVARSACLLIVGFLVAEGFTAGWAAARLSYDFRYLEGWGPFIVEIGIGLLGQRSC